MKDNCKTITKETYKIIKCWEWDAGESFIEYFGDNCWGINEIELIEDNQGGEL